MKKIIKLLYKLYPKLFYECVCSDFLAEIPKKVTDNALGVFEERREKLQKWFLYQAYILQRRAVNDIKKADMYLGMLTNIKMYLTLIGEESVVIKEKKENKKEVKHDIAEELNAVEKFKKGFAKQK